MTRSFSAALRRARRLMRPPPVSRSIRAAQKKMTGLMIASTLAHIGQGAGRAASAGSRQGTALQRLAALMPGAVRPGPVPRIPPGAQYLTQSHRSAAGSRAYRLYLPASRPRRPRGLIVMLHGCSQNPDDFAVGTHMNALAETHGLAVAWPEQTRRHNAGSCWNWFLPADQARGRGEPAILAALTRKLMRDFGLGREAVFVAGLSAGGAMAAILADTYPEVFSAAGIHSGLARGAAQDARSALVTMRQGPQGAPAAQTAPSPSAPVRRIVFHGTADSTVHPAHAARIVAAALGPAAVPAQVVSRSVRGRGYVRSRFAGPHGVVRLELWMIDGGGHAWSGGRAKGSFTDATGPDASAQMVRFFLATSA